LGNIPSVPEFPVPEFPQDKKGYRILIFQTPVLAAKMLRFCEASEDVLQYNHVNPSLASKPQNREALLELIKVELPLGLR
jgi:hypothetical protein